MHIRNCHSILIIFLSFLLVSCKYCSKSTVKLNIDVSFLSKPEFCNENNLSKETGHYVDEISELRKAFIMAKSNYELEKIHFDSKRLVQKYPHSFEAQKLHDCVYLYKSHVS